MILILLYHSIDSETDYIHSVDPEDFESQMRFINGYFNTVSLKEIEQHLNNESTLEGINVAVTFDDGFKDNYTNAFPVLKKNNIPATIFLTVNNINSIIKANNERFKGLGLEDIEEMKNNSLIDFQPHTYSHPILTDLASEDIKRELEKSNNYFKETLSMNPKYFAYPKAKVDQKTKEITKDYYKLAFAGSGVVSNSNIDKYRISRISIYKKDRKFRFRLKLLYKILKSF